MLLPTDVSVAKQSHRPAIAMTITPSGLTCGRRVAGECGCGDDSDCGVHGASTDGVSGQWPERHA